MRLRNTIAAIGVAALLGPAAAFAADTPDALAAETAKAKPACEQLTGTRIRPKKDRINCPVSASPLRSHSEEDIQRTGEMNLSDALRKLDPAFH